MSEQVAGDGVTGRWTVEPCPECGDIALCGCGLEQCGHHGERNPVEVVPAGQLQGAVEALQMVQRLVCLPPDVILNDTERVRRIKLVVDTALHPHGGQS